MHAPRRAAGTSRRSVRRGRKRYTLCGLPRPVGPPPSRKRGRFGISRAWPSGAIYLAVAVCVLWVIRNSPIVPVDPSHGALVMRFTIEDFANATR